MKSIHSLIIDIQNLLKQRDWVTPGLAEGFSASVAERLTEQFKEREGKSSLRLSRMGPQCPCALWYSVHHPELAEQLPPWAEFKYSFGHIIEAQAIMLAKAAGHSVTGEQDAVTVDGIVGHRDCIIDGCMVDVKSAASRSYQKFKDRSIAQSDTFGYLDQLDGYVVGSLDDPLLLVKDKAYLLAIDKQLGHMCLYEHKVRGQRIRERVAEAKQIISLSDAPSCTCGTVEDGKGGNLKLDTKASYSSYKFCCFPTLRVFLYSDGPRYLTKVVRRPIRSDGTLIPEVDRNNKMVYT